jgi:hypothetical protein
MITFACKIVINVMFIVIYRYVIARLARSNPGIRPGCFLFRYFVVTNDGVLGTSLFLIV